MIEILDPIKIIDLYTKGFFPMAENENSNNIKFYKPDKRCLIPIYAFHLPKRLFKDFKKNNHKLTLDSVFQDVINNCSLPRKKEKNTWINEVIKNTAHSFVATVLLVLLGVVAAIAASYFVNNNFLSLLLSYCPGGIYEVAVIAIAFDLDPNFVAFHHIIRLLMILFMVPVIIKFIDKKN